MEFNRLLSSAISTYGEPELEDNYNRSNSQRKTETRYK